MILLKELFMSYFSRVLLTEGVPDRRKVWIERGTSEKAPKKVRTAEGWRAEINTYKKSSKERIWEERDERNKNPP
jgi:hypothetical protein